MAGVNALTAEVVARMGNRTDIAARSLVWLNDGYFELLLTPRFSFWELDSSTTITTADTTRVYPLTATTDLWFILDIRDDTNQRKLDLTHWSAQDRVQRTAGQPTRYNRFGTDLELDPVPDGTYTLTLRYRKRPAELAEGGSHLLGREWDEVLTVLAVAKGWEALEQWEKAGAQRQILDSMLAVREEAHRLEDADAETTLGPEMMGW